MSLAIRGIDANIAWNEKGSFIRDAHRDLKADFVLANPPFNDEDWGYSKVKGDARWRFGEPPAGGSRKQKDGSVIHVDGGNSNFAWIQHFIHHLAPNGITGFVMANGAMSSKTSGEREIRKKIIEADLVDCMIALPGQLFYTTAIPACLWFLARNKKNGKFRNRKGHTLFIDTRKMGTLIDRRHRELSDAEIERVARTYHAWRGEPESDKYEDVPGFCKDATLEEIKSHGHVLTPGRYVGAEDIEDDGEPFDEKMPRLVDTLNEQFAKSAKLCKAIKSNLKAFGYG